MEVIDSHAHLDFYPAADRVGIIKRMQEAKVRAVSIGTHAADWPIIAQIAAENKGTVVHTVGLHPTEVKENWAEEIKLLEKFLENNSGNDLVGVGEFGLDFFRLEDNPDKNKIVEWQRKAFAAQIGIVKNFHCPCVIHSRGPGAYEEIVATLDAAGVDWTKFVFHCYSGGAKEIRELNARGGRGSFTGIITFKNGQLMREALLAQSPERLMVETDSPFLAPEPYRGKQNEPAWVVNVLKKAAELYGMDEATLAKMAEENTKSFYGIKGW